MYIQSKAKDVVFTIISGGLLLALALTWNAGNHVKGSLEICEFKLKSCEADLKSEKEMHERTKASLKEQLNTVKSSTLPLIDTHQAIIEMLDRWNGKGYLSESMTREFVQILKKQ